MCLAVPGRLVERFEIEGLPMGRIDFGGMFRQVCLVCVPAARIGDFVVVHVGFALTVIDEEEAARSLALLDELGMTERDEGDAS